MQQGYGLAAQNLSGAQAAQANMPKELGVLQRVDGVRSGLQELRGRLERFHERLEGSGSEKTYWPLRSVSGGIESQKDILRSGGGLCSWHAFKDIGRRVYDRGQMIIGLACAFLGASCTFWYSGTRAASIDLGETHHLHKMALGCAIATVILVL